MALHQVALVGRRMDTLLLGVKEFHPDRLYLIYTGITSEVYKPMLSMLDSSVKVEAFGFDPYAARDIYDWCCSLRSSLPEGDVLQYNLTEGTKVAAWGCLHAAYETDDDAFYFSQEGECMHFLTARRYPTRSVISNLEFVCLFGNTLSSYNNVSDMLPADVITAREVKSFIETHQKTYQRIQHQFRTQFGARVEKLPGQFDVDRDKGVKVFQGAEGLRIIDRGKVLLDTDNPCAARLFFTGRWWEVLVSDMVYRWDLRRHSGAAAVSGSGRNVSATGASMPDPSAPTPGSGAAMSPSEVWRNVEFSGPQGGKTMNELDILVNDSRRLLLLECKSGYIAQECIYKIDSVRDTYGGQHSKSVLVSYYPLDANQQRKCDDLRVYAFAPATESERFRHLERLPAFLDSVVSEIE